MKTQYQKEFFVFEIMTTQNKNLIFVTALVFTDSIDLILVLLTVK